MGKKPSNTSASGSTLSRSVTNETTNKASILKSSFAPSSFQLQLFASVIQSFDCQQLRLHDITTGRLRQQHAATPGTEITSLDWGYYGSISSTDRSSGKKKRKRSHRTSENAVVAYGTSLSEVCMYSPSEGRVVGKLSGIHDKGIRDFRFTADDTGEAWSIGGDAKLVHWDLLSNTAIRTIALPDPSIGILAQPLSSIPQVICGSNKPYSIDCSSDDERIDPYDAFKNSIHGILRSGKHPADTSEVFIAVDRDRYLNVFDIDQKKLARTLVAGSEVQHVDLYSPETSDSLSQDQMLAVVTRDGAVELFPQPFHHLSTINGDIRSKRKGMTRKSQSQLKLVLSGTKRAVPIYTVSFNGSYITIVSVDGGVDPSFQKIRWQDEGTGELLFEGVKEITKEQASSALNTAHMNGVKEMGKNYVDDSRTVVVNGNAELHSSGPPIEISSEGEENATEEESEAEAEDAEDEDEDDEDVSDNVLEENGALVEQEQTESDEEMVDAEADEGEPSFGDMLASRHPETIAIENTLVHHVDDQRQTTQLAVPSGMSLGTVLTQALRSNDNNLLESCLHANDEGIIQNTIQRLDSGLAAILLSKLAERLASRPGRYGHLLSWVQWTCIAHGGAIAGQPDVTAKLKTLYQVLDQRSSSLDQLLLLKGKLDMLEAQLAFRKQIQAQRGALRDGDEPGMIYIEGEDDNWSSEEDHDEAPAMPKQLGFKTKVPLRKDLSKIVSKDSTSEEEDDDDDEEEEDMPTTNGIASGESDEEEEESDSEIDASGQRRKGLVDVEAEVSGEEDESDSNEGEGDDLRDSEEDEENDDDEEDSSMDDFINDGEISEVSEEDDLDIDEDDIPRKPAIKRSKRG